MVSQILRSGPSNSTNLRWPDRTRLDSRRFCLTLKGPATQFSQWCSARCGKRVDLCRPGGRATRRDNEPPFGRSPEAARTPRYSNTVVRQQPDRRRDRCLPSRFARLSHRKSCPMTMSPVVIPAVVGQWERREAMQENAGPALRAGSRAAFRFSPWPACVPRHVGRMCRTSVTCVSQLVSRPSKSCQVENTSSGHARCSAE